jgi:alpha-D-ribose 1-methylphosphonate 5-triphosphate synthase subunit PhnG
MKRIRSHEADEQEARRAAMATIAAAPAEALERLWRDAGLACDAEAVRGPETGLVTVRGRIGGGGSPFNFGEATVTRATVRIAGGEVGHAYALGRDRHKVRIAAVLDAQWQAAGTRATVEDAVIAPLRTMMAEGDARRRDETAATKVDFFTLVRGED